MPTDAELRKLARKALELGKLPRTEPTRTWGGPGVGAGCAVCDEPITAGEMEYELQFARPPEAPGLDKYHVHIRCAAIWELERTPGNSRPKRTPKRKAGK